MRSTKIFCAFLFTVLLSSCASVRQAAVEPVQSVSQQAATASPKIPSASPTPALPLPTQTPALSPSPSSQPTPSPPAAVISPLPGAPSSNIQPTEGVSLPRGLPMSGKNADGNETRHRISDNDEACIKNNILLKSQLTLDFDGDGRKETLNLTVSTDFVNRKVIDCNKPVRIKMTIGSSQEVFESTWNDGVDLRIADFDARDSYLDIYMYISGTDIDGYFKIFRYNGLKFSAYTGFGAQNPHLTYDGNGKIYFLEKYQRYDEKRRRFENGPFIGVLDYRKNEVSTYKYAP